MKRVLCVVVLLACALLSGCLTLGPPDDPSIFFPPPNNHWSAHK